MFKVGDKVIAIDNPSGGDLEIAIYYGVDLPVKGEIYTVTRAFSLKGYRYIWLAELNHGGTDGFLIRSFRKVEPNRFTNSITRELAEKEILEERIEEPKREPAHV